MNTLDEKQPWYLCPYQRYFARATGEEVPKNWRECLEKREEYSHEKNRSGNFDLEVSPTVSVETPSTEPPTPTYEKQPNNLPFKIITQSPNSNKFIDLKIDTR